LQRVDWQIPDLTERLRVLPREKCALFAGGCVAHAISVMPEWVHDHAATRQRDSRQGVQQLQASLDRLLAWILTREGDAIAELRIVMEQCFPDPAHLFLGEIDLYVVVMRSWECVAADEDVEDRVWRASQAALESYAALTHWYIYYQDPAHPIHGRAARIEARLREPMCIAELRFQCDVLRHIEQMSIAPDLTYDAMFRAAEPAAHNP
jgi:hypothetical protein